MRYILLLLCVCALGAVAWHGIRIGTDKRYGAGAPQIQQMVDTGIRDALSGLADEAVKIETDGRHVTLSGPVNGQQRKDEILAAAGAVPLLGRLTDRIEMLETISPYIFSATRTEDGKLTLDGFAPSREIEDRILSQARGLAGGTAVDSKLIVAAGAPDGDWLALIESGLTALSALEAGRFELSDLNASISGRAADEEATATLASALLSSPDATWSTDIEGGAPEPEAFVFSALKAADGSIIIDGVAPDRETADLLKAAASAAGASPAEGQLDVVEGMPADWSDVVQGGLTALNSAQSGVVTITGSADAGSTVAFTANVDTNDDLAAMMPFIDVNWTTDVTVLNPPPPADVTVIQTADGSLSARGVLPDGLDIRSFSAMLPGIDASEIDIGTVGQAEDWLPPGEALNIVLPRLDTATARISGRTLMLVGTLKREFSAAGSAAAVQTVMPDTWEVDLDLRESAPLSEVIMSIRDGNVALSGVLPFGLTAEDTLRITGDTASGESLVTGGDGDAAGWRQTFEALSGAIPLFRDATGEISERSIQLDGVTAAGYSPNDVQTWLSERLPEGWSVGLTGEASEASEGDARRNLTTGVAETYRSGYWLPDVDFPVSKEQCSAEIAATLSTEQVSFVTGSSRIDQQAAAVLNRLAAVAVRCLNSSVIKLEIAGHTDSVGDDSANQTLSEDRARAVMEALTARGVRADAMTATGYGENQPVDTNNTPEGRARNRRIDFVWSDRDT